MVSSCATEFYGLTNGYSVIINAVDRSFRDVEATAYGAARFMKQRDPPDLVKSQNASRPLLDG